MNAREITAEQLYDTLRTLPEEQLRQVMDFVEELESAGKLADYSGDEPVAPARPAVEPAPVPAKDAEFSLAAGPVGSAAKGPGEEDDLWADDDILSWDVDSLVADLSREEQQNLKSRLESRR